MQLSVINSRYNYYLDGTPLLKFEIEQNQDRARTLCECLNRAAVLEFALAFNPEGKQLPQTCGGVGLLQLICSLCEYQDIELMGS